MHPQSKACQRLAELYRRLIQRMHAYDRMARALHARRMPLRLHVELLQSRLMMSASPVGLATVVTQNQSMSRHFVVNSAPTTNTMPSAQTATENSPLVFSSSNGNAIYIGTGWNYVELDAAHGTLTLATTSGLSFSSGNGTSNTTMQFGGSVAAMNAAIDGLIFNPATNFIGSAPITLITSTNGLLGLGLLGSSTTYSIPVTVAAPHVNQPPTIILPATQTTLKNCPVTFSSSGGNAITVSDSDANGGTEQVTLIATNGTLSLPNPTHVIISSGTGTHDSSVTFAGTLLALNAELDGLTFTPAANASGSGTLSVSIDDLANTGTGGYKSVTSTVTVNIHSSFFVTTAADIADGNTTSIASLLTNPGADGKISLREAILAANNMPGSHEIDFNIASSGVQTINVASVLPTLSAAITINGTTEPGYTGAPLIELSGQGTPAGTNGLIVDASNSSVLGLAIYGFRGNGIDVAPVGVSGVTIQGNYIGINAAGTAIYNGTGIVLQNSANDTIGGTTASTRNVISGNFNAGLEIDGAASTGTIISGNYIGTNPAGTAAIANGTEGIYLNGAAEETIGGTVGGAGNVISGNTAGGILIAGATAIGNQMLGNYIGINWLGIGAIGNGQAGITLDGSNNTIGGAASGAGNIISGNAGGGILINSSSVGDLVLGNYIGINSSSTGVIGNGQNGITIDGSENIVGGSANGAGNVISGNAAGGILIRGASAIGNQVLGNYIGTNSVGTAALANGGYGIDITGGATYNSIGTETTNSVNLTSTFSHRGIVADDTIFPGGGLDGDGSALSANLLGATQVWNGNVFNFGAVGGNDAITASGQTIALPPGQDSTLTFLGMAVNGNVANQSFVVTYTDGTTQTFTQSLSDWATPPPNYSGESTVATFGYRDIAAAPGTQNGPYHLYGYSFALDSAKTLQSIKLPTNAKVQLLAIDVTPAGRGAENIISGNGGYGVEIAGLSTVGNVVRGNFIGVNSTGNGALSNGNDGVYLNATTGNIVGGAIAAARNVISGNNIAANHDDGIWISGGSANTVQGNYIGTDSIGTAAIGNYEDGINIQSSSDNVIGGTLPSEANVIAFNNSGVVVWQGGATGNFIRGNSIYGNTTIGIDLGADGITANTGSRNSSLPNSGMNFPVITASGLSGTSLTLTGYVGSAASQTGFAGAALEFFISDDSGSNGQGKTFIGTLLADANGNFSGTLTTTGLAVGDYITATATDTSGNTSEFSANVAVQATNQPPMVGVPSAQTANENASFVFSTGNGDGITVVDADAAGLFEEVTLNVSDGTLTLATTNGLNFLSNTQNDDGLLNFMGTLASINAALDGMTFTPDTNYTGTDTLGIIVNDLGHSGAGGAQQVSTSVNLTIVQNNQPPAIAAPSSVSTGENSSIAFASSAGTAIAVSDIDANGGIEQASLSVPSGTLTLSGTTGLTFANGTQNGSALITVEGTLPSINSALDSLRFNPAQDFYGTINLTIAGNDNGNTGIGGSLTASATVSITVRAVSEQPSVTNAAIVKNQQSIDGLVITPNPLDGTAQGYYQIASITAGTLFLHDGTTPISNGQFITFAQGSAGLRFTPFFNSMAHGSFTIESSALPGVAGLVPGNVNATIVINGLVLNVSALQTTLEDVPLVLSSVGGNAVTLSDSTPGSGVVTLYLAANNGIVTLGDVANLSFSTGGNGRSSMIFSGTVSAVNASLSNLTFTPSTHFSGPANIQIRLSDSGHTGTGSPQVNSANVMIDVVQVASMPQWVANSGLVISNQSAAPITTDALQATDTYSFPNQLLFALATVPSIGTLLLNGQPLQAGGSFTQADIDHGRLSYASGGTQSANDGFAFVVTDASGSSLPQAFFHIQINSPDSGHGGQIVIPPEQVPVPPVPSSVLPPASGADTTPRQSGGNSGFSTTGYIQSTSSSGGSEGSNGSASASSASDSAGDAGGTPSHPASGGSDHSAKELTIPAILNGVSGKIVTTPLTHGLARLLSDPLVGVPSTAKQMIALPGFVGEEEAASHGSILKLADDDVVVIDGNGINMGAITAGRGTYTSQGKIAALNLNSPLWRDLDLAEEDVISDHKIRVIAGSASIVSVGVSVMYFVWAVRAGSILSSLLSSMPAWKLVDPLPILDQMAASARARKQDGEDDDDTLESLVDGARAHA